MADLSLAAIPLFSELDDKALSALAMRAVNRSFPRNSIIIHEGDLSDSLYVVLAGRLKVLLSDDEGKEMILAYLEPGDFFGELALLDDAPRTASVTTMETCKLAIISKTAFDEYLSAHTDIAIAMLRGIARRMRTTIYNAKNLALMDVYGRTANILLELAREEDGRFITDKISQQDVANHVGASREMVSRILKDLRAGGYIDIENKRIVINKALPEHW